MSLRFMCVTSYHIVYNTASGQIEQEGKAGKIYLTLAVYRIIFALSILRYKKNIFHPHWTVPERSERKLPASVHVETGSFWCAR